LALTLVALVAVVKHSTAVVTNSIPVAESALEGGRFSAVSADIKDFVCLIVEEIEVVVAA
jgi:hypothetical protein